MRRRRPVLSAALVTVAVVLAACSGDDTAGTTSSTEAPAPTDAPTTTTDSPTTTIEGGAGTPDPDTRYRATIRRTSDGVPHIVADDLASVFFGQGYASGQDYSCTLADQLLKVQSRRAAAYGPGEGDRYLSSDLAWASIGIDRLARQDYPGVSDLVRDQFEAFAAGWNAHLADVGADGLAGWCTGTDWVEPVTGEDLYAYARSIALNASGSRLADFIASAQPPAPAADVGESSDDESAAPAAVALMPEPLASNGWAVGRDLTESGEGGLLVANPHFPWEGELRFWESHLTVPGELDIYGVQLTGLPGIGIGFTETFGWTHTVSAGSRFTAYTLTLAPGDPTSYLVDGEPRAMSSQDVTIQVRQDDGSLEEVTRTLWASEYGPILDFPGVGWSDGLVITYRDANLDNDEFIEQYAAMNAARDLDELIEAHRTHQGVPLFNTIAVSDDGRAWYADTSATPKLSAEAEALYRERLETDLFTQTARQSGAVLLDGSDSRFVWEEVPGARDPGLVPWDELPKVERTDVVYNANDSFWLNNPEELLAGDFSILHGPQDTIRSLRTRQNHIVLTNESPLRPAGDDGLFSGEELRDAAVMNESFPAVVWLDAVVERCTGVGLVEVDELAWNDGSVALPAEFVDVSDACAVLSAWHGTYDVDAPGAPLWREWLSRFPSAAFAGDGSLWAEPFDPADPVGTPSGLAPAPAEGDDPVLVNLARAVQALAKAGFAVDATMGDAQFAARSAERVPVHGGTGLDGVTNVVSWGGLGSSTEPAPERAEAIAPGSTLRADGYPISYGTSFLLTVDLSGDAPRAWAFLLYANSEHRSSPRFDEQLRRFAAKDWREVLLTDAAIDADPELEVLEVLGD